jgi:hypothetical protein
MAMDCGTAMDGAAVASFAIACGALNLVSVKYAICHRDEQGLEWRFITRASPST